MIVIEADRPIVYVDDDEVDRFILTKVLEKSELTNDLVLFDGGEAGLNHMEDVAAGRSVAPALILLDINMPGMTGFDLLRKIRSRTEFTAIPVVTMLTSSEAEGDRKVAEELGANDFLTKQSGIEEFVNLINDKFVNSGR